MMMTKMMSEACLVAYVHVPLLVQKLRGLYFVSQIALRVAMLGPEDNWDYYLEIAPCVYNQNSPRWCRGSPPSLSV